MQAFVEAMGELSIFYWEQYENGNRDVIVVLRPEEANLLRAHRLALVHGWGGQQIKAMQGLQHLYTHSGRRADWRRLVEGIVPEFVDPETERSLPGREDQWSLVTEYRVHLAREERKWDEAERLQQVRVDWNRQRAAPVLKLPRLSLDRSQRHTVRTLAASLGLVGLIRLELGRADCVAAYEESLNLNESIGDRAGAASCAFNLGRAYVATTTLRDIRQAECWYHRSLELTDEHDRMQRGRIQGQLGLLAIERFEEAREQERPEDEQLQLLNEAANSYQEALKHFPADAVDELAVTHNQLGNILCRMGDSLRGVEYYRDAIRYREKQGNGHGASRTRINVAVALVAAGRLQDALEYVRAALRGFESYGKSATVDIQKAHELIELIEQHL